MKFIKTLSLLFVFALSTNIQAQIKTPAASPSAKIEQTVGLTDITVEYSRPSMKDRTIFAPNGLVPFGSLWRTGANRVTNITFSDDVTIEGQELAKGKYAILTIPNPNEWTVNFYTYEKSGWSGYTEKEAALSVTVKPVKIPSTIESFVIMFDGLRNESATMEMIWENTVVPINIGVSSDDRVMADIEKTMAGPSAGEYYTAASYYHDSKKDMSQALKWIQTATAVESPKFWHVRREALILADMGKFEDAIKTAKLSKELAIAADYQEYVRLNDESIAMWMKKLKK